MFAWASTGMVGRPFTAKAPRRFRSLRTLHANHTCPPALAWRQAAFLEALAAEGDEAWATAERAFCPVLRRRPELAAEATALAKAKGGCCAGRAALCCEELRCGLLWAAPAERGAACTHLPDMPPIQALLFTASPHSAALCKGQSWPPVLPVLLPAASGPLARALLGSAADDAAAQQELVAALLPVFCEKVLAAKERGTAGALACWGALASAASEEQVTGGGWTAAGGWIHGLVPAVASSRPLPSAPLWLAAPPAMLVYVPGSGLEIDPAMGG